LSPLGGGGSTRSDAARSGAHTIAACAGSARRARVNGSGEVFLSHTKLDGLYVLRLAVGNIRTEEKHVRCAWELLQDAASRVTR
jgi:hypothetical protein